MRGINKRDNMRLCLTLFPLVAILIKISDEHKCPTVQNQIVGKRLPNIVYIKIEKIIGFQMCLRKCEAISSCLSINYDRLRLECYLNDREESGSNRLEDDEMYFYAEIERPDYHSNMCGNVNCNKYSTCITTKINRKICIETACSESVPDIQNGQIVKAMMDFPALATYACNTNYVAIGNIHITWCPIGGKWAPLDIRCQHKQFYVTHGHYGPVQVSVSGTWGTVCHTRFFWDEADVVCRSIGFRRAVQVEGYAKLGQGSGPILMDGVSCLGDEPTLLDCNYASASDCTHADDVGVRCAT